MPASGRGVSLSWGGSRGHRIHASGGWNCLAAFGRGTGQAQGLPQRRPRRSLIWGRRAGPLVVEGYLKSNTRRVEGCQGGRCGGSPPAQGRAEGPTVQRESGRRIPPLCQRKERGLAVTLLQPEAWECVPQLRTTPFRSCLWRRQLTTFQSLQGLLPDALGMPGRSRRLGSNLPVAIDTVPILRGRCCGPNIADCSGRPPDPSLCATQSRAQSA